jgi:hypothetical protein
MPQNRPQPGQYAPSFEKYIALVPEGDYQTILESQLQLWRQLPGSLTDKQAGFRYAPDKWSVKEIVGHVSDAERVFSYRLLRIARGDQTPLPGFEQDDYIKTANSSARSLASLLEEFESVRRASITLVRSLDDKAWLQRGVASNKEISATALAFIIAGHERHHWVILQERYLPFLDKA